ncbi:similar to Saccharomyces cerevisiae YAR035W YAT1 Outer mitochondrial carnitine acetyltransferase [Maudiozyma saulgeensis]|uniref:Similar to Saccharomyces cerevisiae YAR035W YAT1 Outer mitochondrial carnitine acetyltransferase n=1 Tax=Maudiozyma saulgeensis TaxID=1789683 RepID=A0A1X7R3L9_9SACH|nr:similar to Saccharomyces cerevisiae YAR035W YAT1 Outer mitochondrial carnitine acetyltransferase [Kazachstania saulgeensis]
MTTSTVIEKIDRPPRLPIPPLKDTLERFIKRIEPLQDDKQNARTKKTVYSPENLELLESLHERLINYDKELAIEQPESSYIERFWYDSYLEYDASVVLNVNPFFQLQDDPTIVDTSATDSGPYGYSTVQVKRAAKLTTSILKFIRELRHGTMKPDTIKGKHLSMDQYKKLFGSSRIPPGPGEQSCHLQTDTTSHHVIVMYKSQFYWFDVLDTNNNPIFSTAEEMEWNLYSIIMDGKENTKKNSSSNLPFGVFTTESRRVWSNIRDYIYRSEDSNNWKILKIIESALFVICLDDVSFGDSPKDKRELAKSLLCGTSKIELDFKKTNVPLNVQHGTCLNRWFDKLQLIITRNGKAGINFEHTGFDGHTVLRLAIDIYTDSILSFARGVSKNVPDIFHNKKAQIIKNNDEDILSSSPSSTNLANLITIPRKLEWKADNFLLSSLHFAETRISDLISQYEFVTLDFDKFGADHIKSLFKCSPDAFVQQVFQIAYYALYGKFETTYEPAMTKGFQNGRTEAIRTVTLECKKFVKSLFDRNATDDDRKTFLQQACKQHSTITRECSMGQGQDRHLYALYSVWNLWYKDSMPLPPIFNDKSWSILSTNVISTSNCGNSCLKNFGFGPVTANGFGIGYIIRDNSISIVVSSRHRQTHRFVSLIERSFLEVDHIFNRDLDEIMDEAARVTPNQSSDYLVGMHRDTRNGIAPVAKSKDLRFLLGGYDYFDVSVSG